MRKISAWLSTEAPAAAFPAALLAGLGICAAWTADHVLTPITTRHIQFLDAMELATAANAHVISAIHADLRELRRKDDTQKLGRIDDTLNAPTERD